MVSVMICHYSLAYLIYLIFHVKVISYRGKWGKVSHLFSWLRGRETMKIELSFNLGCESLIFCEEIRGKIKNKKIHKTH